jgi:membrane-associated phospholipid phosphatase
VFRAALVLLALATATATAQADDEPWYRGRYGNNRILHLSIAVGGAVLYPALSPVERALVPDACRWCEPNALDRAARGRFLWTDTGRADFTSDIAAYVMAPGISVGGLLLGTLSNASLARSIDDLVPVLEASVAARWTSRIIKLAVGRQRPYAHYVGPIDDDDNLSFPSGHTISAFSVATAAGMVAHLRGYKSEPLIWIGGLALATTTGYLRIAADKHYLTDVLAGAALGTAFGLTVPLLMRRNSEVAPVVSASIGGFAISGVW